MAIAPARASFASIVEALWAVCAVSITKSEAMALNTTGALGQVSMRVRACERYTPAPGWAPWHAAMPFVCSAAA